MLQEEFVHLRHEERPAQLLTWHEPSPSQLRGDFLSVLPRNTGMGTQQLWVGQERGDQGFLAW